uniref:CR032 protein n=1 Tax=Plectus sambesii TaxID=2011161 RepID=A0A914WUA6_9BILA
MVCIPCIIVPAALFIYLKFLQPIILRFVPQRWQAWLDSLLYPTCPVKPPVASSTAAKHNHSDISEGECCKGASTNTVESRTVTAGGDGDKKND